MAYHDGNLTDKRVARLTTLGYTGSVNDQLLAWLNHNSGVTPSNGSVTHTGTGVSVMTVTGTPTRSFKVTVTVTKAGANLAALPEVDIDLHEGKVIHIVAIAAYAVPNSGVTLHFTNASFVLNDTYKFSSTGLPATLNDAWSKFFDNASIAAGSFNERAFAYLSGITGLVTAAGSHALSDLWREFWAGSYGPT